MTQAAAKKLAAQFKVSLAASATPQRAEFEKSYHKSSLRFLGATVPAVRKECQAFYRSHKALPRQDLDRVVDALWDSGCHELRSVAVCLMTKYVKLYTKRDLEQLRCWIAESAGWAHVDWISTGVVFPIYEADDSAYKTLQSWAKSDDFWVRRAALLAHLRGASSGDRRHFERFAALAAPMVEEKEFFIRKAIGWVLREVSKKNPEWTREFLVDHPNVSGLTFREGSKYLPQKELRRVEAARNA